MIRWAILSGEYPPQPGGVSDYTWLVARELAAAGDEVCVYVPNAKGSRPDDRGVVIRSLPGQFGPRSLAILDRFLLGRPRPDRILVQYVPQAYGCKGMNLGFAAWLNARARLAAPVWMMFHEVATPFAWRPLRLAVLATATRVMARLVAGAASRVFVSIPAWGPFLKNLNPAVKSPEWLPVPCTFEEDVSREWEQPSQLRTQLAPGGEPLIGHFGTFGVHLASVLVPTLAAVFALAPGVRVLLAGRRSIEFAREFATNHPAFADRVLATGVLSGVDLIPHLRACDLLLQPFLDGISSRRTSAMAGLACGLPIVTNLGPLSEEVWRDTTAAVPAPEPAALARRTAELLADPAERSRIGSRGAELYRNRFAIAHTIAALRGESR